MLFSDFGFALINRGPPPSPTLWTTSGRQDVGLFAKMCPPGNSTGDDWQSSHGFSGRLLLSQQTVVSRAKDLFICFGWIWHWADLSQRWLQTSTGGSHPSEKHPPQGRNGGECGPAVAHLWRWLPVGNKCTIAGGETERSCGRESEVPPVAGVPSFTTKETLKEGGHPTGDFNNGQREHHGRDCCLHSTDISASFIGAVHICSWRGGLKVRDRWNPWNSNTDKKTW